MVTVEEEGDEGEDERKGREPDQMTPAEALRKGSLITTRAAGERATKRQAEMMIKRSQKRLKSHQVTVGTNVLVRIPQYDCSKADLLNILGVVGKITDIEKVGIIIWTEHGALDATFYPNEYKVLDQQHLTLENAKDSPKLSIRQCAKLVSNVGGQGIMRCDCTSSTKSCTRRCRCKKTM